MISKEQWQQLEDELKGPCAMAKLKLGDDELSIGRIPVTESKTALLVCINRKVNQRWGYPKDIAGEDYRPIVEKIWRKRTKAKYDAKTQKEIIKIWGKRQAKREYPDLESRHEWYEPLFVSASSLVRQYKRIEGLELVSIGYQPEQVSITVKAAIND